MRIGINTGLVFWGTIGGRSGVDLTAMGDVVNIAARIQQSICPPGRVMVSAETIRRVHPIFDFESPQHLIIKGKTEPIIARLVIGEKAQRGPVRGLPGLYAPLVGRDEEMAILKATFERALADHCWQGVALTGEPGVGKSRLRNEFVNWIRQAYPQTRVLTGRCLTHTQATPYYPVADLVRELFGIGRDANTPTILERLSEGLRELDPTTSETEFNYRLGSLANVFGIPLADDPLQALGPEQYRDRTLLSLERLLLASSAAAPLLIVVEDLHWSDALSILFMERLMRMVRHDLTDGHTALLLSISRPAEDAESPTARLLEQMTQPPHQTLALCPLASEEVSLLITELLEGADLPRDLVSLVLERAQGNPFFVEEILRSFMEDGTLARDAGTGTWQVTRAVDTAHVPHTVEDVLAARLDRLPAEDKRMAQNAAIIGRVFWQQLLVEVTDPQQDRPAAVEASLARLEVRQWVTRLATSQITDDWEWVFRHVLIQEVAYAGVARVVRRRVHSQVARWLEARMGDRTGNLVPLIAYHYERGGEPKKAFEYLNRAGEQAAANFANTEAIAYFSRALDLISEASHAERYALLLSRENVYHVQGDRGGQSQDLAALEKLAETLDDKQRAEVALRQARYAEATGNFPSAIAAARTAIQLAQAGQTTGLEAEGYLAWGRALWRQGDYQAAQGQLETALTLARSAQLPQVEADGLRNLGIVIANQGNYAEARSCFERSMLISRETGDRWGESGSLNDLGILSFRLDNPAGAKGYFEQALTIRREIGDRRGEGEVLNNLGVVLEAQSDYALSSIYFEQALRIYRAIGDRQGEDLALGNLGAAFHHLGDYDRARTSYEYALQICREIGDRQGEAEILNHLALLSHQVNNDQASCEYSQQALLIARELGDRSLEAHTLTHLGHALASLGHLTEAADAYGQALGLRRKLGEHNLAMEALAGLARVAQTQGDLARAQSLVKEILKHLEANTLDGAREPLRVYLTCYRVLSAVQDPRAQAILDTAFSQLQEQAAKITDEDMRRSFMENVPVHREILNEFASPSPTARAASA
jgi:tetratricopeptide (TPR) repeat protein